MGHTLVVTLIRHGLTSYNEEKRYLGWKDLSLSANGTEKLHRLSPEFINHPMDLLVTSDLLRCIETAHLLFPNQPYVTISKLREFHFGNWEGNTYEQLKHQDLYRKWIKYPRKVTPPNGESYQHFESRTREAFLELLTLAAAKKSKHVTVICHGGVIRQWLSTYSPVERSFFEWSVPISSCFKLIGNLDEVRRGLPFISLLEEPIMEKTNGF